MPRVVEAHPTQAPMLVHLAIADLAIIDRATIDFAAGLNVMTGETGAGKSIVLDALGLVLGDRARADLIRRGADRAEVQALFRLSADDATVARLRAHDLPVDDGGGDDGTVDVLLRRLVRQGGKGRAWVNGVLVPVRTLADVARGLVDIASQHQHTELLQADRHLPLLDRFGQLEQEHASYAESWTAVVTARQTLAALRQREADRLKREDYVRFQLAELDDLAARPGEDEELARERDRLAHGDKLLRGAREAEFRLIGREGAAAEQLVASVRPLDRLAIVDPDLLPLAERLETARIEIEDIAYELRRYGDQVEVDPRRLAAVEDRLAGLKRLQRKHALDLAGLAELADELRAEVDAFDSLDVTIAEAEAAVAAAETEAEARAAVLSAARRAAAGMLSAGVTGELAELAMPGATLRFEVTERDGLGPDGLDRGEMLLEPNPGEGFKPLARVASGGELSRLLLALKGGLARIDPVATSVFDEVDTGVGGATADVIGLKLKAQAQHRQVITITHLPQIAAHAGHHALVEKQVEGGRTTTHVRVLTTEERRDELARMLGGVEITRRTREHAAELLGRGA